MKLASSLALFVTISGSLSLPACSPGGADEGDDKDKDEDPADDVDTSAFSGRVAFTSTTDQALWVRDLGDNAVLYTAQAEGELPDLITLQAPALSVDGGVLAYWRLGPIDGVLAGESGQVVVVDLRTGAEVRVPYDLGGDAVRMSYSPWPNADGSLVAYREALVEGISDPLTSTTSVGLGIFDGETATTFFTDAALEPTNLRLTADGAEVLFAVADTNNDFELYRVSTSGGVATRVALDTHPDIDSLEFISGGGWDASDDGSVIAFAGGIADGAVGEGRVGLFFMKDGAVTRVGDITGILEVDVSGDGTRLTAYALTETAERVIYTAETAAPTPVVTLESALAAGQSLVGGRLNAQGDALVYGAGSVAVPELRVMSLADGEDALIISSEIDERYFHLAGTSSISFR